MIMNLWIDDDPNRKSPDGWFVARDSATALLFVATFHNTLESISFDHDLGGGDTSVPVVDYIERMAWRGEFNTPITMTVHSANPVGAKRIQRAIDQTYKWWGLHDDVRNALSKGIKS